jgi:hypothetical protein
LVDLENKFVQSIIRILQIVGLDFVAMNQIKEYQLNLHQLEGKFVFVREFINRIGLLGRLVMGC